MEDKTVFKTSNIMINGQSLKGLFQSLSRTSKLSLHFSNFNTNLSWDYATSGVPELLIIR